MMIDIPIQLINLGLLYKNNNINSRIDIDDQEIINEITASIGKVTFAILNDKNNIHCSDHHFVLLLYPGNESYNILKSALSLLVAELEEIQSGFFNLASNYWNIVLYLSVDWKFLSICQGHKAASSKDYCLWCSVKKTQNGILEINNIYNKTWNYTPLTGDDKIKILKHFDFMTIFSFNRATKIHELWNSFFTLYKDMKNLEISGEEFAIKARQWIQLFLTPSKGNINKPETFEHGLYRPEDITLYIHTMVYHVPEFIDLYCQFGIDVFSYQAVERKNHEH
ncbi:7534_t:CDS:2, partial [Gigaspora margarita]